MYTTNDYEKAVEAHNKAFAAYEVVRDGYRARTVDDATYLAARKAYTVATAEFDRAWTVAMRRR